MPNRGNYWDGPDNPSVRPNGHLSLEKAIKDGHFLLMKYMVVHEMVKDHFVNKAIF